jgi:tRNA nucleotidyltransferase (CCA-adding enzyme)
MFEPVLQKLEPFAREFVRHGKQVYLVGGAVRNLLLGRPVNDFDFTTDALPSEVQTFFRKVLPTGLQHGTVTVLFQGDSYEVTTFRVDGDYTDGRRPDGVTFTPSLEEDLRRRDFTINALALNLADGTLADFHGGHADLQAGVLRAIGDPGQRFDEDALRLLRLFRFSAQLRFAIEAHTLAAVGPRRPQLAKVSRERIREELAKAMAGVQPSLAWGPLGQLGFLNDLFAPLAPAVLPSRGLATLDGLPADLRWSYWLTAAGGGDRSQWESVLKGLTFSNADVAAALGPCKALDWITPSHPLGTRAKAVIEAWGSRQRVEPGLEYLRALEADGLWSDDAGLQAEILRATTATEPVFVGELAVSGKDLILAGIKAGPGLGETLRALQQAVWANPELNEPGALLRLVRPVL